MASYMRAFQRLGWCFGQQDPDLASIKDIVHRFKDLKSFEGGIVYRALLDAVREENDEINDTDDEHLLQCLSRRKTGTRRQASFRAGTAMLEERAKEAFLAAVIIEGKDKASIEDLKETLRKHYNLGATRFRFGILEATPGALEAAQIGTKMISLNDDDDLETDRYNKFNRHGSKSSVGDQSTATSTSASTPITSVVLFYYLFELDDEME